MTKTNFTLVVLISALVGALVTAALTLGPGVAGRGHGHAQQAGAAALIPISSEPVPPGNGATVLNAVPQLVSFQGVLTNPGGQPVSDDTRNMTFRIFDAATGGNLEWDEKQMVTTDGGLFRVLLGDNVPLTAAVFDGTPRFLEVQVETDTPLAPRQRFVSTPYAFHAETADTANSAKTAGKAGIANDLSCSGCVDSSELAPGAGAAPSGAIILWDGGACPSAYTRLTSYDDKFLVGSGTAGITGGSNTHTHDAGTFAGAGHTHSISDVSTGIGWNAQHGIGGVSGSNAVVSSEFQSVIAEAGGGGSFSGTSAPADSRPAFKTILLCKKD